MAPIIVTLAYNYKHQNNLHGLQNLKSVIKLLPKGEVLSILKTKIPELFDNNQK